MPFSSYLVPPHSPVFPCDGYSDLAGCYEVMFHLVYYAVLIVLLVRRVSHWRSLRSRVTVPGSLE